MVYLHKKKEHFLHLLSSMLKNPCRDSRCSHCWCVELVLFVFVCVVIVITVVALVVSQGFVVLTIEGYSVTKRVLRIPVYSFAFSLSVPINVCGKVVNCLTGRNLSVVSLVTFLYSLIFFLNFVVIVVVIFYDKTSGKRAP